MDMHMQFIPDWMMNTFIPNAMHEELMTMKIAAEKAFKDTDSVYRKRIQEKPNYYKPIEEFVLKI